MRERRDLKEYNIQIAANIVAGTQWAWTRENPHLTGDSLNPKEVVRQVENLTSKNKEWIDFTKNMNA